MKHSGLMISMDCGILDSTFPDSLEKLREDLEAVLEGLQNSIAENLTDVKLFLVIRFIDDSNEYKQRKPRFQEKTIYADVVIRPNAISVNASFTEFAPRIFAILRTTFHNIEVFSQEKGILFNGSLYLRAIEVLEEFYAGQIPA